MLRRPARRCGPGSGQRRPGGARPAGARLAGGGAVLAGGGDPGRARRGRFATATAPFLQRLLGVFLLVAVASRHTARGRRARITLRGSASLGIPRPGSTCTPASVSTATPARSEDGLAAVLHGAVLVVARRAVAERDHRIGREEREENTASRLRALQAASNARAKATGSDLRSLRPKVAALVAPASGAAAARASAAGGHRDREAGAAPDARPGRSGSRRRWQDR